MKNIGLACATIVFREMPLQRALELIAHSGYRKVELTIVPEFCPHYELDGRSDARLAELKGALARESQAIVALSLVPGFFNSSEADEAAKAIEHGVDLAAQLGASIVSLPSGRAVSEEKWHESMVQIGEYLSKIADYAEERGITICVEAPHKNTFAEDIDDTVRFFEHLRDERVKCTFDTSHAFRGEKISLLEAASRIGQDRIEHIHLRDVLGEDISITPGKGNARIGEFLAELRGSGYDGHLVVELEYEGYTIDQRRRELRFSRQYILQSWRGERLPAVLRLRTSRFFQFLERLYRNPKREIKRHPWLIGPIRRLRPYISRLEPLTIYDGHWRRKWYILGRDRIVIHPANSVRLRSPPQEEIRVGIFGCGYAGSMHAHGYERLHGIRVVGVCDIVHNKAEALAAKLDCSTYPTLGDMIREQRPDVVSVCTREWEHHAPVIELLESDIDVFCEKIMASRFEQGREMVEIARNRGRTLAVNYNYRFIPGIVKVKELITRQLMGELQILDISVHAFSYHHALDLVHFLGGAIEKISASFEMDDSIRSFGGTDWSLYDPDIIYVPSKNLAAIFQLQSGAVATIRSSYLYDPRSFILSVEAIFEQGAVELSGLNLYDVVGSLTWTSRKRPLGLDMNHKQQVFARGYEYTFYRSIEAFMNGYLTDGRSMTTGEEGLHNMRLEKVVHRAGKNDQAIPITPVLSDD